MQTARATTVRRTTAFRVRRSLISPYTGPSRQAATVPSRRHNHRHFELRLHAFYPSQQWQWLATSACRHRNSCRSSLPSPSVNIGGRSGARSTVQCCQPQFVMGRTRRGSGEQWGASATKRLKNVACAVFGLSTSSCGFRGFFVSSVDIVLKLRRLPSWMKVAEAIEEPV